VRGSPDPALTVGLHSSRTTSRNRYIFTHAVTILSKFAVPVFARRQLQGMVS
jgi:hypothetical protein